MWRNSALRSSDINRRDSDVEIVWKRLARSWSILYLDRHFPVKLVEDVCSPGKQAPLLDVHHNPRSHTDDMGLAYRRVGSLHLLHDNPGSPFVSFLGRIHGENQPFQWSSHDSIL